ncbi:MAG: DNA-processing protein DprA [Tissierellia bacterium]|nr:DNA-processing protein DprA [Tissierellia bacterium]
MTNKEILTYLNFLKIRNSKILDIIKFISPKDLFEVDREELDFLDKKTIDKIFDKDNFEKFKYYKEEIIKNNIRISSILDDSYPINLRDINDAPALFYYKGQLEKEDKFSVAIVGARKCTDYGKYVCKSLTKELSNLSITTISGLALGIDAICHKTSIENNSKTIGIIGNGIDQIYPKRNRRLYEMMQKDHLIISEFPLKTPPLAYNFPQRNRIISGMSLATVVIEAKEKSGTLITANFAAEQGRDVLAVPGNINSFYSKGTNKLIQDGAKLVSNIDDVINEILPLKDYVDKNKSIKKDTSSLDKEEKKVYDFILKNSPCSTQKIVDYMRIDISIANYLITSLELKDFIESSGNDEYTAKG